MSNYPPLCPAGCVPCAPTYWRTGRHYSQCCSSSLCGTPEQARETERYIAAKRREGKSVATTGALKTFIATEKAKETDALKTWLGPTFDADVTAWLDAEAGYAKAVNEWLAAEARYISTDLPLWLQVEAEWQADVNEWLAAEVAWIADVTVWLEAEANQPEPEAEAPAPAPEVADLEAFRAELIAKAAANRKARTVHHVAEEAAPAHAKATALAHAAKRH
jgi:hypothetical protein